MEDILRDIRNTFWRGAIVSMKDLIYVNCPIQEYLSGLLGILQINKNRFKKHYPTCK